MAVLGIFALCQGTAGGHAMYRLAQPASASHPASSLQAGVWQDAISSTEDFEVVSFASSIDPVALMRTNLLENFPLKVKIGENLKNEKHNKDGPIVDLGWLLYVSIAFNLTFKVNSY